MINLIFHLYSNIFPHVWIQILSLISEAQYIKYLIEMRSECTKTKFELNLNTYRNK